MGHLRHRFECSDAMQVIVDEVSTLDMLLSTGGRCEHSWQYIGECHGMGIPSAVLEAVPEKEACVDVSSGAPKALALLSYSVQGAFEACRDSAMPEYSPRDIVLTAVHEACAVDGA
ncbi:hypothetical protein LSCM4_01125 [Leishmania orientalis]|uniref:Uncharacterized protein n=1 Tax=Leishmania orientalis TaxID=2249476 RepID=A0A836KD46_9TRYP|nr:hypothetical protein LSCM4_01125 [Leishmania orientalis]